MPIVFNPFTGNFDFTGTSGGGGGTVTNVTSGNANQITVIDNTTTPIITIPSNFIPPGTVSPVGQFLAENGSSSAPGYAFANFPNNGLYSDSSSHIGLVSGGNTLIDFNGIIADFDAVILSTNAFLSAAQFCFNVKNPVSYPYTSVTSDNFIAVTTTSPRVINLETIANVQSGFYLMIKDVSGLAGSDAITINAHSGETIDGASSFIISTNYGSISLIASSSTNWSVV
jgi:hypothetical protein